MSPDQTLIYHLDIAKPHLPGVLGILSQDPTGYRDLEDKPRRTWASGPRRSKISREIMACEIAALIHSKGGGILDSHRHAVRQGINVPPYYIPDLIQFCSLDILYVRGRIP